MTCGFDVHVSMFWVKPDYLLDGYLGIKRKNIYMYIKIIDKLLTK